jgi:hypothetical protein
VRDLNAMENETLKIEKSEKRDRRVLNFQFSIFNLPPQEAHNA